MLKNEYGRVRCNLNYFISVLGEIYDEKNQIEGKN